MRVSGIEETKFWRVVADHWQTKETALGGKRRNLMYGRRDGMWRGPSGLAPTVDEHGHEPLCTVAATPGADGWLVP